MQPCQKINDTGAQITRAWSKCVEDMELAVIKSEKCLVGGFSFA